ncbi:TPA: peptide ABC transporter ATP-binding protein, partial [Campylobacter upsaliensis]|nr:peptide ABC transporter ATP-binding protein [Campylobacter upsaliensis]
MIKTENLCKKYGDLEVLRSISTQIKKGDVVALIGPSGG